MRSIRWVKYEDDGIRFVAYSNDKPRMRSLGWIEDGYWESEGNKIVSFMEPMLASCIDERKAPGS